MNHWSLGKSESILPLLLIFIVPILYSLCFPGILLEAAIRFNKDLLLLWILQLPSGHFKPFVNELSFLSFFSDQLGILL